MTGGIPVITTIAQLLKKHYNITEIVNITADISVRKNNIVRSLSKVLEVPPPGRDFFRSNILVRTKHVCCSTVGVPRSTKNDPEQKLKCLFNFKTIQNFTTKILITGNQAVSSHFPTVLSRCWLGDMNSLKDSLMRDADQPGLIYLS